MSDDIKTAPEAKMEAQRRAATTWDIKVQKKILEGEGEIKAM